MNMKPLDVVPNGEILSIIGRVSAWAGDEERATIWYRTHPIEALGGRTAEDLVKSGQTSILMAYIDHLSAGGFS